ncbi:unnamed protein product [Symbiodinium natans]|uniref:Uncharacterized protein n=1 Tax=Symbiodinium natans TaxID=878477 RepID=A0A812LRF4_9DINO|nr:unnamed protein product [Symbiodinium natans]
MEKANCETKCREDEKCNFFWHGTQHSASVCRTFAACDSLVREFGLDGTLSAMPREKHCQVADAALCWQTSLRRAYMARPPGMQKASAAGKVEVAPVPPKPADPPSAGMVSWFKSEDAGVLWRSSVGNFVGFAVRDGPVRRSAAGFGADRPVTYLEGSYADEFQFGAVLPDTFTLCSVTRYTDSDPGKQFRILQGRNHNFLHGHHNGRVGVAHYGEWVAYSDKKLHDLNWLVFCGTNKAKLIFDGSRNVAWSSRLPLGDLKETLVINTGKFPSSQSNFGVMEVITWNRALSEAEMKQVTKYLDWKLKAGTFEQTETLGDPMRDFWLYSSSQDHIDADKTFTYKDKMINGYTLTTRGWEHMRSYARGFVRSSPGFAYAVVSGLEPKARYVYEIYSWENGDHRCVWNRVFINGGNVWSRMRQHWSLRPAASGVAVATDAGEIEFKMERRCDHLHFSSISVAKILHVSAKPPAKPSDPPSKGMVSWFRSEDAGSVWKSSVGDFVGVSTKNSVWRASAAGFGADRPVTYIQGFHDDAFSFGAILKSSFTMCSVSRYTGRNVAGKFGRILQGKDHNLLQGHWKGHVGVAYYGDWVTYPYHHRYDMNWMVMCGTNKAKLVYSGLKNFGDYNFAASKSRHETFPDSVVINAGYKAGEDSVSDFAVMEVITWDRALAQSEMESAIRYLKWKLQAGTFQVSAEMETDSKPWTLAYKWVGTESTVTRDIANGYKLELTGWKDMRKEARGYVRNEPGSATAVVLNLVPNALYRFEVHSFSEKEEWSCHENLIAVNHGAYAHMRQDISRQPSASGVIYASPRGKIQFELVRKCNTHVHLTHVSIARIYGDNRVVSMLASEAEASQRSELAASSYAVTGFPNLHLYEQCDAQLLLGGMGVHSCSHPTFRWPLSHAWSHKRKLPDTFQHGQRLFLSCWSERFSGLNKAKASFGQYLQCVDGKWDGPAKSFECEECLQVAGKGYMDLDDRDKQELYFFNRMQLHITSELGMKDVKDLAGPPSRYCLEKDAESHAMTLHPKESCNTAFFAEIIPSSESHERMFQYLADGSSDSQSKPQCLQADPTKVFMLEDCNDTKVAQQIDPFEVPLKMFSLHVMEDQQRTTDLHGAYTSLCGAHGALNNLDFWQLFGGSSSNARTSCIFSPLIQFGKSTDSKISRDKNSDVWDDWWHILAENPVKCETGQALTGVKLDVVKKSYQYECSYIGGLGACFEYFSGQAEVPYFKGDRGSWEKTLSKLVVSCGENSVISSFHFEFSEGGRWARVRYFCCKAGGSPTVIEPAGYRKPAGDDGKYCPQSLDVSGRPVYKSADGKLLQFDTDKGKWCIGDKCGEVDDAVTPLRLGGLPFEVVNISNFDGVFEALGVPKQQPKKKSNLKALLGMLKKPEKPKLPKMPELEEFEATMPTYSAECLNYKDLWKKITETYKNAEDEQVTEDAALEADPGTAEKTMQDYHPCEVAKNVNGIFGPLGKGDGTDTPENMLYDDVDKCFAGDAERDLLAAEKEYSGVHREWARTIGTAAAEMVCDALPDVEIAPFGAGVQVTSGDLCQGTLDLTNDILDFGYDMHDASFDMKLGQEGFDACNPMQIGFARMFCDLHCTRDAVVRGDRSIIRNLETATRKTNTNIKNMAKWSFDSTKLLNEYIASKQDYSDELNTIYFKEILSHLGADNALLQRSADAMMLEIKSLAETAGARYGKAASRSTAQDALQQFVQGADLPDAPNASEATAFLQRLHDLHATLHRAASGNEKKSNIILRQLAGDVSRLQGQVQGQLHILGVYRSQSRSETVSKQGQFASQMSGFERHSMLVSLDQVWWRLRNRMDQYEDIAHDELMAFQAAFTDMENFEACTVSFSDLILSYTNAMATLKESHRELRATWREASNLLGELVSIVVDGDAFGTFRRLEGCQSSLALQTVHQAQAAVKGLYFLKYRMKAASFEKPDETTILEAVQRLRDSYGHAMQGCSGSPFTSV